CMRTRSQSRRRRQQQVPPTIVEPFDTEQPKEPSNPPVDTMADNRTMAQMLQAPTEGYEDAIVVPAITADNFELKHSLLNLVQNKQFFGHDKEDPHAHIRYFNKITSTMKFPNVPMILPWTSGGMLRLPEVLVTSLLLWNEVFELLRRKDDEALRRKGGDDSALSLKNELRKLKEKDVVDTAVSKPSATTIALGMFKINLEPLPPKLLNNREAHMDYLKHTREQTAFLREIVKQGRSLNPLDSTLNYALKS
ncbi:hypothetical protein Tco_1239595, partial [Tanacetum coccineum]